MAGHPSETEARNTPKLRVVETFFACAKHGDFDGMRGYFAPNATVWYNNGRPEQTVGENIAFVSAVASALSGGLSYEVTRRAVTEDGVFSQHVMRGELLDGTEVRLDVVMFLRVADDRIHRIEEYFDSAQADKLLGHLDL